MSPTFNYEFKTWGSPPIKPSPFYIQGLKLRYLLEDLAFAKGKILDIGCGAGNLSKAVKRYRPHLQVYAADISPRAIHAAQTDPQGVNFQVAPAQKLPFPDHTFTAITMFDVLEHLPRLDRALREIRRLLRKQGVFHIFIPLDKQPWTLYWLAYRFGWQPKDHQSGHLHVFSHREFSQLLENHGFQLVKVRFSFHWLFSFFDLAYFSLLELLHCRPSTSIEGLLARRKKSPPVSAFNLFYRLVVALGYFESRLFSHLPGGGGHYLFKVQSK